MNFSEFLLEGRFDNETTLIVREIMRVISHNFDKLKEGGSLCASNLKKFSGISLSSCYFLLLPKGVPDFFISVSPENQTHVNGGFTPEQNIIKINIYVGLPDGLRSLEQVQYELRNIIRHELEHTTQDIKAMAPHGTDIGRTLEDARAYFLSDVEVPAFVSGLYKTAKSSHTPFWKVRMNFCSAVRRLLMSKGFDKAGIDKLQTDIKNTYDAYAKKRFPKAQFFKP